MKYLNTILTLFLICSSLFGQDGKSSLYMQAGKAFKNGDYNKSLSIAKSISKNDPFYENAQLLIGYSYLEMDSLELAENIFMEVLQMH